MTTIAYLAPELTALSATFVYQELGDVERAGFTVVPVSVHRATHRSRDAEALESRTHILYNAPTWHGVRCSFIGFAHLHANGWQALRWLGRDLGNRELAFVQRLKLLYQFLAATKLAGILLDNHCRHLHIHFAHVPTQIGMYAAAMATLPFTVTAHANDIFERGSLLKRRQTEPACCSPSPSITDGICCARASAPKKSPWFVAIPS